MVPSAKKFSQSNNTTEKSDISKHQEELIFLTILKLDPKHSPDYTQEIETMCAW